MSSASRSKRLARHAEPELAIVGGGIGGLTLALALERRGVACCVFEQSPDFAEEGVGLQLSPNATRLLRALGVGDAVRAIAVRPQAIELLDWSGGRRIFRAPLGETCERRFGAPLCTVRRKACCAMR
jgi:salicylate hydroxylase